MQSAQLRRGGTRAHGGRSATAVQPDPAPRRRSHGDATGGHQRPQQAQHRPQQRRQARPEPQQAGADLVRRRRSNVMFMLVLASGATLFLAATTKEPAMLYLFAASFLGLCGYLYLLAQARQREAQEWGNDWMYR